MGKRRRKRSNQNTVNEIEEQLRKQRLKQQSRQLEATQDESPHQEEASEEETFTSPPPRQKSLFELAALHHPRLSSRSMTRSLTDSIARRFSKNAIIRHLQISDYDQEGIARPGVDIKYKTRSNYAHWYRTFDILPEQTLEKGLPAYTTVITGTNYKGATWIGWKHIRCIWSEAGGIIQLASYTPDTCVTAGGRWGDSLTFNILSTDGVKSFSARYAEKLALNDVCFKSDEPVVVAAHSYDYGGIFATSIPTISDMHPFIKVRGLPHAEALSVRNCGINQFMFGYRSGLVSIFDWRSYEATYTSDAMPASVTGTYTIRDGQQFVARTIFGDMCLYDTRKKGIVCEYETPPDSHRLLTGHCSGLLTNPSENVLLSPFVSEVPCLGFWNLQSGKFVDTLALANEMEDTVDSVSRSISWVELCQKRSVGYEWHEGSPRRNPNKFGVWYKCGQGGDDHCCSLHHVALPERL